jgi:hypothetical protein
MKKVLLSLGLLVCLSAAQAQTYKDHFTNAPTAPATSSYWGTATGYTSTWVSPTYNSLVRTTAAGDYTSIAYLPYENPEMSGAGTQITAVDMSGTNQDSIFIIAKASVAGATLRVDIKDANDYVANSGTITQRVTLTTSYATYKMVFTTPQDGAYGGTGCSSGPCTVNKATIKEFLFSINDGNSIASDITVDIDYFQVGGTSATVISSNKNAASTLASSKVYPNPVSDVANVELNLKSASNVKVTLSDMMGKEVMTIAEGNVMELNKSFNVTSLNKGIYTVNYFVDGSAAKAEMLMVK